MTKRAHCTRKHHAIENPPSDGWPPMASVGTDRSGLTDYQSDDFSQDLIAGAVVGIVTVPQAIAYAYLAELAPQARPVRMLAAYVDLRRVWQFKTSRCWPSSRRRSAGGFRYRTARAELR